ncbi:unnamed protein product [Alopecurus aequalis]
MVSTMAANLLGLIGLLAALMSLAAAAELSRAELSMPNANGGPSYHFHGESCPKLRQMVHDSVEEAIKEDVGVVAGLLQISFHDCFPQGCDASLLLSSDEPGSEMSMPPNKRIRPNALGLIEDIRAKVHAACGATVSCTDVMNLAVREAVTHFRVPRYAVPVGLLDSPRPAPQEKVFHMPLPDFNAAQLVATFASRGFDVDDVVALSGAHTVGASLCSEFRDRLVVDEDDGENTDEFARWLQANCSGHPDRLQDLDVTTPERFDNTYYRNLLAGEGVLTSDVQLLHNDTTSRLVARFARDQGLFFSQFAASMSKMAHLPSELGSDGEIRRYSCFWPNSRGPEGPAARRAASS